MDDNSASLIAVVTSQSNNEDVEKKSIVDVVKDGAEKETVDVAESRWKFLRENLDKVLEYGRREGLIDRKQINLVVADKEKQAGASSAFGHADEDDELEREAKKELSFMHSAIPYLPLVPAVVCFGANIIFPGSGTLLSGLLAMCCGKCRMQIKEFRKGATLVVNVLVAFCQLITIVFLLVGWFWSIAWGGRIMIHACKTMNSTD